MKKIIRAEKRVPETAEYFCDFTGKKLGDIAAAHVEVQCGYSSDRDGTFYNLHLSDDALNELMAYLRLRMYPRKVADSASNYMIGGSCEYIGSEDNLSKEPLRAIVQKQIEKSNRVGRSRKKAQG
jgi:hypothetical protein